MFVSISATCRSIEIDVGEIENHAVVGAEQGEGVVANAATLFPDHTQSQTAICLIPIDEYQRMLQIVDRLLLFEGKVCA